MERQPLTTNDDSKPSNKKKVTIIVVVLIFLVGILILGYFLGWYESKKDGFNNIEKFGSCPQGPPGPAGPAAYNKLTELVLGSDTTKKNEGGGTGLSRAIATDAGLLKINFNGDFKDGVSVDGGSKFVVNPPLQANDGIRNYRGLGPYKIWFAGNDKCLDNGQFGDNQNGTFNCLDNNHMDISNQQWWYDPVRGSVYNRKADKCLDVDKNADNSTKFVLKGCDSGRTEQRFVLTDYGSLRSVWTGNCMDMGNNNRSSGCYTDGTNSNQKLTFRTF